jgi:hypothetical protein
MTYRYAAALALVGWYLMLPPPMALTPRFDSKAPLDKWTTDSKYKTAGKCKHMLAARRMHERRADIEPRLWSFGRCVSANDPRLKAQ